MSDFLEHEAAALSEELIPFTSESRVVVLTPSLTQKDLGFRSDFAE